MQPTIEQAAIAEQFTTTTNNLLIVASAGAGKTSLLVQLSKLLSPIELHYFLAFNKAIADTLRTKLPVFCDVFTFNSFGLDWYRSITQGRIKIDGDKVSWLIKDNYPKLKYSEKRAVMRLVSYAKQLRTPSLTQITDEFASNVEYEECANTKLPDIAFDLFNLSLADRNRVDFDDMLQMPILLSQHPATIPKNIFVDEAQDINPIQMEMLNRLIQRGARLVAVGDPSQSIYGFRGAMSNSMQILRDTFSMMPMPLSVSFRCAKAVVKEAQKYDSSNEILVKAND